jgi:hypothetical protein
MGDVYLVCPPLYKGILGVKLDISVTAGRHPLHYRMIEM